MQLTPLVGGVYPATVTAIWGTDPNGRWLPLAPTDYMVD
jgi:hypothetical protein